MKMLQQRKEIIIEKRRRRAEREEEAPLAPDQRGEAGVLGSVNV